jgi:hypothetical protein
MRVALNRRLAEQVRDLVDRYGRASAGTLNPAAVVARAVAAGLPHVAEELDAGARAVVTDQLPLDLDAKESRP